MKRSLIFPPFDNKTLRAALSSFLLALLMLVIALKVPIPLATNSDFKVIYYTDQALTLGIDAYDHPAIGRMASIRSPTRLKRAA